MKPNVLIIDDEQSMCDLLQTDLRLRDLRLLRYLGERCFGSVFQTRIRSRANRSEDAGDRWHSALFAAWSRAGRCARRRDDSVRQLETAIAAIRAGAYDFVTKPIEMVPAGDDSRPGR